jgi:hypothetical protein
MSVDLFEVYAPESRRVKRENGFRAWGSEVWRVRDQSLSG